MGTGPGPGAWAVTPRHGVVSYNLFHRCLLTSFSRDRFSLSSLSHLSCSNMRHHRDTEPLRGTGSCQVDYCLIDTKRAHLHLYPLPLHPHMHWASCTSHIYIYPFLVSTCARTPCKYTPIALVVQLQPPDIYCRVTVSGQYVELAQYWVAQCTMLSCSGAGLFSCLAPNIQRVDLKRDSTCF